MFRINFFLLSVVLLVIATQCITTSRGTLEVESGISWDGPQEAVAEHYPIARKKASVEQSHPPENVDDPEKGEDPEGDISQENEDNKTHNGTEEEEEHEHRYHVAKFDFDYVSTYLLVSIWVLFASCAKIAFHSNEKFTKYFPESCMLIVIGVILGIILYFSKAREYQLNTHTFFLVILPPIILDAGYYMPARAFFDNLGTILMHAIMGTLVNALILGFSLYGVYKAGGFDEGRQMPMLHLLLFASLLAAVDPVAVLAVFEAVHVNEVLYIIVFGESLLNDGIAVVLYHIFDGFSEIGQENIIGVDIVSGVASFVVIVIGSPSIGILCGLFAGFVSRFTHHNRLLEPIVIFIIGYISYLLAEMFHLSGILSCTFCGIAMRKYVEGRISKKSQATIRTVMKTLASVCETIIFMYLGISCVNDKLVWDTAFVLLTLLFVLVIRPIGVVSLTFILNQLRQQPLSVIDQFVMSYGGLRGAIAFALASLLNGDLIKERNLYITSTIVVIYFTNLILGSTIQPLVTLLKVKRQEHCKPTMNGKLCERIIDHTMAGMEVIIDQSGYNRLRLRFSSWNNKYLKPFIIGKNQPARHKGHEIHNVYLQLSERDARHMVRTPSYATDVNRITTFLRRQASIPDFSPSYSDVNLFSRGFFSVPSYSVEEQRMALEKQTSLDNSTTSSDPPKYSKHFNRRSMNCSTVQLTSDTDSSAQLDMQLPDKKDEYERKFRRNGGTSQYPNCAVIEENCLPNEKDPSKLEWHDNMQAIQFSVKTQKPSSAQTSTGEKLNNVTGGYDNPAFKGDYDNDKVVSQPLKSLNDLGKNVNMGIKEPNNNWSSVGSDSGVSENDSPQSCNTPAEPQRQESDQAGEPVTPLNEEAIAILDGQSKEKQLNFYYNIDMPIGRRGTLEDINLSEA